MRTKELNTSIKGKNKAIKRTYKNMPKVKTVYTVTAIFKENDETLFEEFLSYEDADKLYNKILNSREETTYLSFNMVQRGEDVGGIILGTTSEVIKRVTKE